MAIDEGTQGVRGGGKGGGKGQVQLMRARGSTDGEGAIGTSMWGASRRAHAGGQLCKHAGIS